MSEENEFIDWQGGECPVDPDTIVEVMLSNGSVVVNRRAGGFDWQRGNYGGDIVAYHVVKDVRPKVEIPEGFTLCQGGTLSLPDKVIVEFMDSTGLMRLRRASDIRWYNNILFYRVLEEFDASKAFSGATSWSGGSNPVPEHIEVGVLLRKGDVVSNAAHRFTWEHHGSSMDIMAYKRLDGNPLSALQREGFLHWNGGKCPVDSDTVVDVMFSDRSVTTNRRAGELDWLHTNYAGNIIAYRVVKDDVSPKVEIPEGFTPWSGGERPFYPWEHIEVIFDDDTGGSWRAGELRWTYDKDLARNIVAYRREEVSIPEGFTRWDGGECPVAADTQVEVVFADGKNAFVAAKHLQWSNHPDFSIIGYRVVEDEKPKAPTARDIQIGGTHYKKSTVQPWDVVDTWPIDQQIGFHRGNALKYVMRLGTKDENLREIRKAAHYLQKLVEVLEQKGGV